MSNEKNVTIHDLARELNITASTVSRALNNHPRISEATKEKVLKLAESMGYQPNYAAANLRKGKGNNIGVIVPRINRVFFSSIIGSIEEEARRKGYNVMIAQTHENYKNEVESVMALLGARVDGILMSLSAETKNYQHLAQILKHQVTLVFFDRVCKEINASSVVLNDYKAGEDVAKHFLQMGAGTFAFLGGPEYINVYSDRWNGFRNTLLENNISPAKITTVASALTREAGRLYAETSLKENMIPDAVFCVSDFAALGAYQVFREHDIDIPGSVMIAGVANEPFTAFLSPGITSVDQHSEIIGETAVSLFFDQLENKDAGTIQKMIEPRLIIRGSSNRN